MNVCIECGIRSGLRQRCPEHWKANRRRVVSRWHDRNGARWLRERRSDPFGRAVTVAYQHNQTAARYGVPGRITSADLRGLIDDCAYCGGPQVGWDHIVPMSRGGDNVPSNLVPSCKSCNNSKSTKTPDEWLAAGLYRAVAGTRPLPFVRTECRNGHPYTAENRGPSRRSDGSVATRCRVCHRNNARIRRDETGRMAAA